MREHRLFCCAAFFLFTLTAASIGDPSRSVFAAEANYYEPLERKIEGWTLVVDPMLFAEERQEVGTAVLVALANHLQRVRYILPRRRVDELQRVRIWIEWKNPQLTSMQYHPDRGWLEAHGHDPRLAKHVHIPRATALLERHMWAKHPYVVLHELAHAYHDQVLSFEEPRILAAYNEAKRRRLYDRVLLYTGETDVAHYGMTNHKEFFAEATESYLGVNDFFPFVRAELQHHDKLTFALMESIWGTVR